jgi:hypothetical protein
MAIGVRAEKAKPAREAPVGPVAPCASIAKGDDLARAASKGVAKRCPAAWRLTAKSEQSTPLPVTLSPSRPGQVRSRHLLDVAAHLGVGVFRPVDPSVAVNVSGGCPDAHDLVGGLRFIRGGGSRSRCRLTHDSGRSTRRRLACSRSFAVAPAAASQEHRQADE